MDEGYLRLSFCSRPRGINNVTFEIPRKIPLTRWGGGRVYETSIRWKILRNPSCVLIRLRARTKPLKCRCHTAVMRKVKVQHKEGYNSITRRWIVSGPFCLPTTAVTTFLVDRNFSLTLRRHFFVTRQTFKDRKTWRSHHDFTKKLYLLPLIATNYVCISW